MGKYLFFDIDGTLLGKSRRITEKTKQAIQRARKNGHKIFICTGRVPAFIVGDVNDIEVDGIVSGAGSFVEIGGQYIFEHYMESQLTEKVIELFKRHQLLFTLETRDVVYQSPGAEEFFDKKNLEDIQDNPEMMRYQEEVRKGRKRKPLEEFNIAKDKVAKMCFIAPQKEQFSPCIPWLESYFHIVFFSNFKDSFLNGEIILKDCTKGDGIRKVIDYFHGDMEDTIAFGDSMNDYQMLETASISVVFEGAPKKVKDLAAYYFKEPDEDGIYQAMVEIGLIEAFASGKTDYE